MSKVVELEETRAADHPGVEKRIWFDRRLLFIVVMLATSVVYLQFEMWKQPVIGDRANWEYMAQVISRGGVPYRDVVNIKSPLSAYIGAAAIVVTRPFGLRDVYAVRIIYFLLAVLTVGFTYLVTLEYFKSYRIGLLAALIMMSFNSFAGTNSAGIQPKTPMILFGLVTLWLTQKDRPLLAGLFGMLSALSWQPGLLFVGAAGLSFSRYLTSWRDLKVVKLIAGAAIPLAVLILYFWAAGALRDFYIWTVHYNFTVYAHREVQPIPKFLTYLTRMVTQNYRDEHFFFYLASIGFIFVLSQHLHSAVTAGARHLRASAPLHAILIAPLVYFAFCIINVQGSADFFPFLPYVAVFAAVAVISTLDRAIELIKHYWVKPNPTIIQAMGLAAISLLVFFMNVADAFSFHRKFPTLADQEAEIREITSHLKPEDKIFVHGTVEILVLSGMTNASKYFFMDRGKDVYLNNIEPGGFDGWFEHIKADRPRVVALSRLRKVERKGDFQNWVNNEYELRASRIFPYYVRKDDRE